MTDVAITRFRKRLRLPADSLSERDRIDRAIAQSLGDEMFDTALQRAGVIESDEVCIRRVQTVVRLDAANDSLRLATTCSLALAAAIATELSAGGPNVVRYRSVRAALLEMGVQVAQGNLERAWAWRQIGIWDCPELEVANSVALETLFSALADTPHAATHVLARIAELGLLDQCLLQVSESRWRNLVQALLAIHNVHETFGLRETFAMRAVETESEEAITATARAATIAGRVLEWSKILRVRPAKLRNAPPGVAQALSIIAVIECEPSAVSEPIAAPIVRLVVERVTDRARDTREVGNRPANADASETSIDQRTTERTEFGGLLLLLNGVRALELPSRIANIQALQQRSLTWVLRQIGVLLIMRTGCKLDAERLWNDAAVRAFCGAKHDSTSDAFEPVAESEVEALSRIVEQMIQWVVARMSDDDSSSEDDMMRYVITRDAEIVVEAAWIEVRFAVALISTRIRRAGLDLNPDWLPFIGSVVRFTYE